MEEGSQGHFRTTTPDRRYAITMTDYSNKWPEVAFTQYITTDFSRHGNPLRIVTDNKVQFTSPPFTPFLEERQICHNCSSLNYPAADGAVERLNRVLKETL